MPGIDMSKYADKPLPELPRTDEQSLPPTSHTRQASSSEQSLQPSTASAQLRKIKSTLAVRAKASVSAFKPRSKQKHTPSVAIKTIMDQKQHSEDVADRNIARERTFLPRVSSAACTDLPRRRDPPASHRPVIGRVQPLMPINDDPHSEDTADWNVMQSLLGPYARPGDDPSLQPQCRNDARGSPDRTRWPYQKYKPFDQT